MLETRPENVRLHLKLAELYGRAGDYVRGLEIDEKLVVLLPENSTVHYNRACRLALTNRHAEAIESLERAIDFGYRDAWHLEKDPDFRALRGRPEFQALVQRLENPIREPGDA